MDYLIKDKKFKKIYEIVPYILPKGEELSKLIIYDNILKKQSNIYDEENLSLALKYQIFYKNTSLFAELELSNKIEEKMKLKIIGDKENNVIEIFKKKKVERDYKKYERPKIEVEEEDDMGFCDIFGGGLDDDGFTCIKKEENKKEKKEEKVDLNDKDYIMSIINTQDFIEGYWEENEKTKNIKIKYDKTFNLLKNKNLNDNVSITILIIFFIDEEHPELLDELLMIIKKAKEFIKKTTNTSYEDIIKEFK